MPKRDVKEYLGCIVIAKEINGEIHPVIQDEKGNILSKDMFYELFVRGSFNYLEYDDETES